MATINDLGNVEDPYFQLVLRYRLRSIRSDQELSLIEAKGLSQTAVSKATDITDSTISEALSGKRALNRRHIGKLARYFGVSPDTFAF